MTEPNSNPTAITTKRVFFTVVALVVVATTLIAVGAFFPQIGFFWLAFLAGIFGASVALIHRLQKSPQWNEEFADSWMTILIPLLYGGMLAAVTYFLFVSEIITGSGGTGLISIDLFPNFSSGRAEGELLTIRDFLRSRPTELSDAGKLMVWCFLSGYSEGFVTGMLGRLGKQTGVD